MEPASPMEETPDESFATPESHAHQASAHSKKRLLDSSDTNAEGGEVSPWGTQSSEPRRAKVARLGERSNGGNSAQAAVPFGSPRTLIMDNIDTSRVRSLLAAAQPSMDSRRVMMNRFKKICAQTPRVDPQVVGIDDHKRATDVALRGLSILRTKATNFLKIQENEAARRALREKSLKMHEALVFDERRREAMRKAAEEAWVREAEEARVREAEEARTWEAEEARLIEAEEVRVREAEEVRLREAEEARVREAEEARVREAEKVRLRETEEVRLRETEEVRLRETEEVRLRETEEVRLRETEEVRLREAEEARLIEAEEVRLRETEEVRLRETEEVRLRETEEVRLRETEEVRLRETEEVRLRETEEARAKSKEAEAAAALVKNQAKSGTKERIPLTWQQQQQVLAAWTAKGDGEDIMVKAFNDTIYKKSMITLRDGLWLGDEVVNMYMRMLMQRNREAIASGRLVPKCGIMTSFFFTAISDSGKGYRYAGVKNFTRKAKIDLFGLDRFIFPVNVNKTHWTVGVIDFRRQRLEHYDSLSGRGFEDLHGFEYMVRFVDDESKAKRGSGMDISHWPRVNVARRPMQRNGFDCGVFACMFADRLSKGIPLDFSQSDITHCREVMTLAILRGERSPSEEERCIEDWGSPREGFAWWSGDDDDYEPRYGGGQLRPEPWANGF